MAAPQSEEVIDAVYRVVLDPTAWDDVMRLMAQTFPSAAQTFYYLHRNPRRVQPVCLAGVDTGWLRTFNALYFAPDNPWIRLTERLHLPGVVRTNERLDRLLQAPGSLYRSAYYNDWMRPHGFKFTLGNTLVAQGDLVANITLFRPPGMKTFSAGEVRTFEALSRHMTRALQMAIRLEHPGNVPSMTAAFEALGCPVAVIDDRRRMRYANSSMETLLRRGGGLAVRAGELVATAAESQAALVAFIERMAQRAPDPGEGRAGLPLRDPEGCRLTLNATPLGSTAATATSASRAYLLTVSHAAAARPLDGDDLRRRFDCSRTEARIAQLLAQGRNLRAAAAEMGITYETARAYLKSVFAKTGVHAQAELVALVLRGAPPPGATD